MPFLFVYYVCRHYFRAIIASVFMAQLSFLAFFQHLYIFFFSSIYISSFFPSLPSFFLLSFSLPRIGTIFPRLSTQHLFAEAIWKFNACVLTRKIAISPFWRPTSYRRFAFETISHVFRLLCARACVTHTYLPPHTHTHARTHAHVFVALQTEKFWPDIIFALLTCESCYATYSYTATCNGVSRVKFYFHF